MAGRSKQFKLAGAGIIIACSIALFARYVVFKNRNSVPTVYHHEDGTYSLNKKNGPAVKPSEVLTYLLSFEEPGGLRLVANSTTKLIDWEPLMAKVVESGLANYELEAGGMVLTFHIPISMTEKEYTKFPEIIRLENAASSTENIYPYYQVLIVANDETKCIDVLAQAWPKAKQGMSVNVFSDRVVLLHDPKLDFGLRPPTPHPTFLNGLPQSLVPYLKVIFN